MVRIKRGLRYSDVDPVKRLGNIKYSVDQQNGCWTVTNYSCKSNDYPRWRSIDDGRMTPIARDIWENSNGKSIPHDCVVVRSCGNKACVNPEHLVLRGKKVTQKLMIERSRAEHGSKKLHDDFFI